MQTVGHQQRFYSPIRHLKICSHLVVNNSISQDLCQFTNDTHIWFTPLITGSICLVGYGGQSVLDTLKYSGTGLIDIVLLKIEDTHPNRATHCLHSTPSLVPSTTALSLSNRARIDLIFWATSGYFYQHVSIHSKVHMSFSTSLSFKNTPNED